MEITVRNTEQKWPKTRKFMVQNVELFFLQVYNGNKFGTLLFYLCLYSGCVWPGFTVYEGYDMGYGNYDGYTTVIGSEST